MNASARHEIGSRNVSEKGALSKLCVSELDEKRKPGKRVKTGKPSARPVLFAKAY